MSLDRTAPSTLTPTTPPEGGIYDLPVVGNGFRRTREFFDDMAPDESDSSGVRAGKQALRYGTVTAVGVGAAALAAVVVL